MAHGVFKQPWDHGRLTQAWDQLKFGSGWLVANPTKKMLKMLECLGNSGKNMIIYNPYHPGNMLLIFFGGCFISYSQIRMVISTHFNTTRPRFSQILPCQLLPCPWYTRRNFALRRAPFDLLPGCGFCSPLRDQHSLRKELCGVWLTMFICVCIYIYICAVYSNMYIYIYICICIYNYNIYIYMSQLPKTRYLAFLGGIQTCSLPKLRS